jgi:hypothetical protein
VRPEIGGLGSDPALPLAGSAALAQWLSLFASFPPHKDGDEKNNSFIVLFRRSKE